MKYSIAWLNELAGTNLSPKEMAELFTRYSFEVDGLEESAEVPEGVVVGKIVEVSKHPNAEKLLLAKVAIDSEEKNILSIVCGASNIATGDVVPVATIGTTLPNGLTLKETLIRGEKSFGMLCAEDELGLGTDHSGILHLPENLPLGVPVSEVLGKKDAVIDLSILSSRGHDALSHIGMAREVRAMAKEMENGKWKMENEEKKMLEVKSWKLEEGGDAGVSVIIEAKEGCARYIGVRVSGIVNGASPEWMQKRLKTCGMRPINLATDVTNYVMLETGQPLHAFDRERITENGKQKTEIHVRNAKKGEKMTLLDGCEIELNEEDIVIANDANVLALAGVMGGKDSATSEATTEIFLEGANFDPMRIRKTRVRHGLNTESSYRFERDIDPNLAQVGAMRAAKLLEELGGGKIEGGVNVYPEPVLPWTIDLDLAYAEKLLGVAVPESEAIEILTSLGMTVQRKMEKGEWKMENMFIATIPTIRRDLRTQEDLIEEIGRLYGYDRIAPVAPKVPLESAPMHPERVFERKFKDTLAAVGCDEILSYSFYRAETAERFGLGATKHFTLQNPMNPDQQLFRSHILPNVLEKAGENLRRFPEVRIFEMGKVYEKNVDGCVQEKKQVVILASGDDAFFEVKGRVETAIAAAGVSGVSFEPIADADIPSYAHKTRVVACMCRGKRVGILAEISPFILRAMKIRTRIAFFEADISALAACAVSVKRYAPIPKFPFVVRDMSLSVPRDVLAGDVSRALAKAIGNSLREAEIFDVYEKDNERSLAFRLSFGDDTRTLTKEEVETMFQKGLEGVGKLGVRLKKG